jgi:hypothetical protein
MKRGGKISLAEVLWVVFVVLFGSFLVERLTWLGQPSMGAVRFGLSLAVAGIFALWFLFNPRAVRFDASSLGFVILILGLMLYENTLVAMGNGNERMCFQLYCAFWLIGFFQLQDRIDVFQRRLVLLGIVAGVVGWLFWFAGPDLLLSVGIGAIDRFWGQNVRLESGIFRSYSVFSDHQTYSAFMQFVATAIRIDDYRKPAKYKRLLIVLILFLTLPNFSTTGFLLILMVLGTYLPWRILVPAIAVVALSAGGLTMIDNPLFHGESLQWRVIFVLRQIEMITWWPHANVQFIVEEGGFGGFTNDCFFTSRCYSHGGLWGILFVVYLGWHYLVVGAAGRKPMGVLMIFLLVNIATNGIPFTSMPLMVMVPIYVGMMMRGMRNPPQLLSPPARA